MDEQLIDIHDMVPGDLYMTSYGLWLMISLTNESVYVLSSSRGNVLVNQFLSGTRSIVSRVNDVDDQCNDERTIR